MSASANANDNPGTPTALPHYAWNDVKALQDAHEAWVKHGTVPSPAHTAAEAEVG